jgi:hypothetical protein
MRLVQTGFAENIFWDNVQRKYRFKTQIKSGKFSMWRNDVKFKFLLLICLLLILNIFAQIDDDVRVESLYLARDDGKGKAGETTQNFFTNDIPIHCVVQLDSMKSVTVKMIFVAVKVIGVKPETKVITTKYKTNGEQSQVNFTGKPDKIWIAGNYRIDIFIDGKQAKSIEFEIQKKPQQIEKTKTVGVKKFRKN